MRLVVASLVIINVVYLAWQLHQPEFPGTEVTDTVGIGPTITLISESGKNDRREALDKVVTNPLVVDDGEGANTCPALGPFDDVLEGQIVLERLISMDFKVNLKAIDQPTGEFDFRVMIPPAASLEEAFRKLRELQSQGIDSYVITRGNDALAISLGVFSTIKAAKAAQQSNYGYESMIAKIQRLDRSYWIVPYGTLEVAKALMQSIITDFSDLEINQVACSEY